VSVADTIRALPAPLVIDHFGRPTAARGVNQPGFDVLLALVREGSAWVKLSGGYRISEHPDWADAAPFARALAEANPDRIVWGTDWPHPGGGGGTRSPDVLEPFFPIDDGRAEPPRRMDREPRAVAQDPRRQPGAAVRLLNPLRRRKNDR
jgi:hypothetical protein